MRGKKGRGVGRDELAFPESRKQQKRTIMLSICFYYWYRLVKWRGRPEIAHRIYLMMIKKASQKKTAVKEKRGLGVVLEDEWRGTVVLNVCVCV